MTCIASLYRMLIATTPDLASVINKRAMLNKVIAKNSEQMAGLTFEMTKLFQQYSTFAVANRDLNQRLDAMQGIRSKGQPEVHREPSTAEGLLSYLASLCG